jgi:hypothetical protein
LKTMHINRPVRMHFFDLLENDLPSRSLASRWDDRGQRVLLRARPSGALL